MDIRPPAQQQGMEMGMGMDPNGAPVDNAMKFARMLFGGGFM
jgi:hypothetical protein